MFDESAWSREDQETKYAEQEQKPKTIADVDLVEIRSGPVSKFILAFVIGFVFLLVPVPWDGQVTVPFDIVASWITDSFPTIAGVYALALIVITVAGKAILWRSFRSGFGRISLRPQRLANSTSKRVMGERY